MSDINKIDLRLVDATILMVFLSLMRHRKATVVATEMGLTQPAISHALKRLRSLYGDELFLRRAHGLEPTAIARELEPKVRRIVRLISETLASEEEFDPQNTTRTFKMAAFDYEHSTILPELITDLRHLSPGISVHSYPYDNRSALSALIESQVDLAVGYFDFPKNEKDSFVADELFTERYVVAVRQNHPAVDHFDTLTKLANIEFVMIAPSGRSRNLVDHALQLQGLSRNVQAIVPSLFAALSIVEKTDLAVILPERVATINAGRFRLTYRPLPINGGDFKIHAVRHIRDANSSIHTWLIEQLRRQVIKIGSS